MKQERELSVQINWLQNRAIILDYVGLPVSIIRKSKAEERTGEKAASEEPSTTVTVWRWTDEGAQEQETRPVSRCKIFS